MAYSGVGTKYHVALATLSDTGILNSSFIGYLLRGRGYSKSDAKIFAPRFGTGEQGLGDLDLYKTWTQNDFSGGMFQEYWSDESQTAISQNILVNAVDKLYYPTPTPAITAVTNWNTLGNFTTNMSYRQTAVYKGKLYIAQNGLGSVGTFGTGKGAVSSYDGTTFTTVKTDFATAVTGLAVLSNMLWVTTNGGLVWCWDGTTWTSDSRYGFGLITTFNGKLYCTGYPTSFDSGKLWSRDTGVGTAGVANLIGEVGDANKIIRKFITFNHRLYMAKEDGLFVYDGVQISTIVDETAVPGGILDMTVLNGAIYFLSGTKLYRFDGSTIALVQGFGNYNIPLSLSYALGRIYIETTQTGAYSSDKNGLVTSTLNHNLYSYDGNGMTLMASVNYDPALVQVGSIGVFTFGMQAIWARCGLSVGTYTTTLRTWTTSSEGLAVATDPGLIVTSQFDASFPTMDKMAAALKVQAESLHASDTIAAEMRTFNGTSWTSYITLGNFTSTVNRIDLVKALQGTGGTLSFKRIQLRFTYNRNAASTGSFKAFALEYILAPVLRRDWTMSVIAQGQSDSALTLADNTTEETTKASTLRDWIYRFRANVPPLLLQDIDTTTLNGAHNASVTTITVANTAAFGFEAGDLITIDDEVIQIGAVTSTSFTGCTRGVYGTTAASHSTGAIVVATYRVVLTKISNENVVSPAIVDGTMDTFGNESEITIQLSEAK